MKAFILTRHETESGACEDDALAYVNGDGVIQVERDGRTMKLCSAREARLLAFRLCRAAECEDEPAPANELEDLRSHVASHVLAEILRRDIHVRWDAEDAVFNVYTDNRWHRWVHTVEQVDETVAKLLSISEVQRRAVPLSRWRDAIRFPVIGARASSQCETHATDHPPGGTPRPGG